MRTYNPPDNIRLLLYHNLLLGNLKGDGEGDLDQRFDNPQSYYLE